MRHHLRIGVLRLWIRLVGCCIAGTFGGLCPLEAQQPGQQIWTFNAGGIVFSSPALGEDGTVYVGAQIDLGEDAFAGKLFAINPDGSQKWEFTADDWIDSSPAIGPEGTVYFGCWDNFLYALDPVDGSLLWRFETGNLIVASPAVAADGTVYVGSGDGIFYALNPDGSLKWAFPTTDDLDSSPAIAEDGTIYFGSGEGVFYALNPDGTEKWSFPVGEAGDGDNGIVSSPAIDLEGNIYFGAGDAAFYSLASDGTINWGIQLEDKIDSSPALGPEGNIYLVSRDGVFVALDSNGIEFWSLIIGDVFFSSPVVDLQGNVYIASFVGSGDNRLFAFNNNGELLWEFQFQDIVDSSPTISPSGTLYVGSNDNQVYAIHGGVGLADSVWPKFSGDAANSGRFQFGEPPSISQQPRPQTVENGEMVAFTVTASGSAPLSFQWLKDGELITGETEAVLTLLDVSSSDAGAYAVVVTNAAGSVLSEEAVLSVNTPADLWSGAEDLGGGWRWLEWFGFFNVSAEPWIFHSAHAWLFPVAETTASLWLFALDMNWLWTSDSVYPNIFRNDDGAWLFYLLDSTNPRWFFNFSTNPWESHDP